MRVYATFDVNGYSLGEFFDEFSHPPVTEMVLVKPEGAPDGLPESEWPLGLRFVRRNDAIPVEAVEISEVGRASIIHAPQFIRWTGSALEEVRPPVDLNAYAASAHAVRRDGGVMVAGVLVKTDSESRGLINGAYALSEARPGAAIDFKAASGWVTLDAATMKAIAIAVGSWVQACYSVYRTVSDGIAAGTITDMAQIDAAFAALGRPE